MTDKSDYEELTKKINEFEESEKRHRKLLDSELVGLYRTTIEDGKLLAANETLARMMGYHSVTTFVEEYITSKKYVDIKSREELVRLLHVNGKVDSFETKLKRADSTEIDIALTATIHPEKGYIEGILVDITESKRAKAALIASERKYRKLVEHLSDVIAIMDENGIIQYKSPNIVEQFGWKAEDLIGLHGLTTVHSEDRERIGTELENLIKNVGERVCVEYNYLCKDGSTKPVELIAINLLDNADIKGVLANYKDITDRKFTEENLRQSEEKYRTMIERSNDMIWTLDTVGNFTFFNKQTEDVTGLKLNEWIGKSFTPLIPEEDLPMIMEIFQNGLKGESSHYDLRIENQSNDGLTISVNTAPIYKDGQVAGVVSFGRDITGQRRTEKEKERLKEQLQQAQKMESIGTLAGGIAHDFNNVLGGIVGYTELAQIHATDNPKVLGYLDQLNAASQRAKELVQQILAFSRQSKSEKSLVDLGLIIKEALKLLRASIPATIEINSNVDTGLGPVEASQIEVHQVVMNLCTNAAYAMEGTESGKLNVELILESSDAVDTQVFQDIVPGNYLKLTVSDSGHGISSENMSRIFDPYFTTKEKGKGTGMGLATVYGIVKDHCGYISVESEVGSGTSFQVLFPLIEDRTILRKESLHSLPLGNEKILLVDDEKALVDVGKEILENLGYKVETRTGSLDALEAFKAQFMQYDLIITDFAMPKMSGLDLAEEIQKIRANIPIILCTGFSENLTTESISRGGIKQVMMKPITLNDLAKVVRLVLDDTSLAKVGEVR